MQAHWKLCIHFAYKNCTRCIQPIYTKCIPYFNKFLYTFCIHLAGVSFDFVYILYTESKETAAKFCIQNVYRSLLKYGIHFLYKNFVYILYTKVCRNMGYILYIYKHFIHFLYKIYTKVWRNVGYILYPHILYTLCINQFWST